MEFTFIFILVVLVFNLRNRVIALEQSARSGAPGYISRPNSQTQSQQPVSVQSPLLQPVEMQSQDELTALDSFTEWLKEDWLMKLGALLLIIGFGWFTTYAFLNNWIGPMGRIAFGIIAGAIFLLVGWWRIDRFIYQGEVFLILGSTTILLTIFAARGVYGFFTPFSALAVMFLSTAFVAFVSVRYNSQSLSLASLVLAGIAPLLTSAPKTDYVGLFSYLFVVILGAVWITILTGRRELTTAALLLITFYSLPHLLSFVSADKGVLLMFAYAFSAVFFLTNTAGILKLKDKDIAPDLITAAGNGLFLLLWIMSAAQNEWKSLIISAWMIVFVVGSFLIFSITKRREPFYTYAGVGIAMLAAATSVELSGETLTIAFTVECVAIPLITYLIIGDIYIAESMATLLIVPVFLSFGSIMSSTWDVSVINKDFFVLFILSAAFLGLGSYFLSCFDVMTESKTRQLNSFLLIAGSVYAYILLWLSLGSAFQNDNTAIMISLAIYTVIGIICYLCGLARGMNILRLYGGTLIGFVVIRLLLVDVWRMDIAGRTATFFLIGTLLISTAFFGHKKQKMDLPVS